MFYHPLAAQPIRKKLVSILFKGLECLLQEYFQDHHRTLENIGPPVRHYFYTKRGSGLWGPKCLTDNTD